MRYLVFPMFLGSAMIMAQGPLPPSMIEQTKGNAEGEAARRSLQLALESIDSSWFGRPYQGVTSVHLQGMLGIALSGQAVNQKVDQLSHGQVKSQSNGGQANLRIKGTYLANVDFRTDLAGDFGTILYARRGDRGFIYSKEQNAYTTRVDRPPSDAPLTYMTWFRQTLNEIKAVYLDAPTFHAKLVGEELVGGRTYQKLIFDAPSQPFDAKKREQSVAKSLGFWKRGRLEIAVDKATKLPQRMKFRNEEQGIQTKVEFTYGTGGRLQGLNLANSSSGFEGPGWLRIGYGPDGLMNAVAGELTSMEKRISFSMDLTWSRLKNLADLYASPPLGATKRGREEFETYLLLGLASQIFDLQRHGLSLRSVPIGTR